MLAAGLAYYTLFALSPLLVLVVAVAGLVFGPAAAEGRLLAELERVVGPETAVFLQNLLAQNLFRPSANIWATVIGGLVLLFGASGVFGQLKRALNAIWHVEPPPRHGVWQFVRTRLLSFLMVFIVGLLLVFTLAASAVLAALRDWLAYWLPPLTPLWSLAGGLLPLLMMVVLLAILFKILPDAEVAWRDVWLGASVTAVLLGVGRYVISLYLRFTGVRSVYGVAGSLVVLLVWVYYSAQILLFGAEFTQVFANRYGSRILSESEVHSQEDNG
ncbi:MAG: YihY/virulence factor BrkB family protein [Chloroflexi bacterium]|nr:MAG: YihY/virulence factor BrkB family protein [Chloroflexota bacterium]